MAVNNLRVIYDNQLDYAGSTITASSTNSSSMLATNLKKDTRSVIWRTAQVNNQVLPVIFKNSSNAATAGTHSSITITSSVAQNSGSTAAAGAVTVTGNGQTEAGSATALPLTFTPDITAGRTSYVVRSYATTTIGTVLDTHTLPVAFSDASQITVAITNDNFNVPTSDGSTPTTNAYVGSGATITVFEGTSPLRYVSGQSTIPGVYTVSSAFTVGSGTLGALTSTNNGASVTSADHTTTVAVSSVVTYSISGRTRSNAAINTTVTQKLVKYTSTTGVRHSTTFSSSSSRAVLLFNNTTTSNILNAVVLTYTNLTDKATMRVLGYNNPTSIVGSTGVPVMQCTAVSAFDSGYSLCSPFESTRQSSWSDNNYGTVTYGLNKSLARDYFNTGTATSVMVEIVEPQSTDGFIEASRFICGRYWSPRHNTEYGLSMGMVDTSENNRSESGDLITSPGVVYKKLDFNLNHLTTTDRNEMVKILRDRGTRKPLFISLFPDNAEDYEQEATFQLYGKLNNLTNLSHPYYQYFATNIQIEEI